MLRVNPYPVTWRIWSAVAQWLRSLVRSQQVSGGFFIDIKSFRSHYGPGVDSPSNRNEYQEYFLGSKGARCVMLTTYHTVPLSRNLGALTSWNPLGLSRPVMRLLYLYVLVSLIGHFLDHRRRNKSFIISDQIKKEEKEQTRSTSVKHRRGI